MTRKIMKKRERNCKKGLSPIIATVLLIMLVLILASLIFLWAKGLISEQIEKNGQAIENVCPSVVFDADIITNDSGHFLEAVNRGSVSIYSLDIKTVGNGESKVNNTQIGVDVGDSLVQRIDDYMTISNPKEVVVYPVLVGKIKGGKVNKPYTCTNIGKTITL